MVLISKAMLSSLCSSAIVGASTGSVNQVGGLKAVAASSSKEHASGSEPLGIHRHDDAQSISQEGWALIINGPKSWVRRAQYGPTSQLPGACGSSLTKNSIV